MNEERVLKTFLELVKIDSPSGNEEVLSEHIFKKIKKLGYKCRKDRLGNITLFIEGVGKPLLLSAHLDTVSPGRNIVPYIENGFVKARGDTILGADNKVAVAAIIDILEDLKTENLLHRPIDVIFTVLEETTGLGASSLNYSNISAKTGYIFDNANPIGTIITASPFYYRLDVKLIGKYAHASRVSQGINVISIFNNALNKIELGHISDKTTVNFGFVRAGQVRNSIPGEMLIFGEVRSFSEKEADNYLKNISLEFKRSARKYGGRAEITVAKENTGYEFNLNDEFILFTKKQMKALGLEPKFKKSLGCSDANTFNENGIKVLDLGDGTMNTHSHDEMVAIESLLKLKSLVLSLIC